MFVGGCVVSGYHLHRVGGTQAAVLQYERHVRTLSHRTE